MRIGIITMHKVRNFGSALQAYGLQFAIEKMGYEVTIIDYKYPNELSSAGKKIRWQTKLRNFLDDIGLLKYLNPEVMYFQEFYKKYHLTKRYNNPQELVSNPPLFDVYMTGSDQVWNPKHTNTDLSFLLNFVPKNRRKIAYAASFACKKLDKQVAEKYIPYLKDYDSVGIREYNGKLLYEALTGLNAEVVIDPSLLLTKKDWENVVAPYNNQWKNQDYILVYFLSYAYNPFPYAFDLVRSVAQKLGKKIICLCLEPNVAEYKCNIPNSEIVRKVGPIQFLQLFLGASFVITTSFHGTAFASNFGKALLSVVNPDSDDDRQSSFLKNIGRDESIWKCGSPLDRIPLEQHFMISKLEQFRAKSYSFLKNSLL